MFLYVLEEKQGKIQEERERKNSQERKGQGKKRDRGLIYKNSIFRFEAYICNRFTWFLTNDEIREKLRSYFLNPIKKEFVKKYVL